MKGGWPYRIDVTASSRKGCISFILTCSCSGQVWIESSFQPDDLLEIEYLHQSI